MINLFGIIICVFYLWTSYHVFMGRTYGSLKYLISIWVLSFSLVITVILYIIYKNQYWLLLPIIPFLIYTYIDNKIKQKMSTIIYKKID